MSARVAVVLALALLALTSAAAAAPVAPAAPASERTQRPDRLARLLDRAWPAGAGGTVLVVRGDGRAACRGRGLADRAARIPAGCDTVYDLMSMTKQFTAAAIVKLEQLGRLRLDDPIARWVGPVPADKRGITLRHLLGHTSGLPEALGGDYEPLSRDEMLDRALHLRLRSVPGRTFRYSNLGYSVLAAIVERASGTSYERFLARQLFRPAGMTQTGYVLPRWRRDRVAVEYDARGRAQGRPYEHPWADDGPWWNLRGNGGMLSTARDMLRWHRALRGERVLGRRAKRELFVPRGQVDEAGFSEGYGWVLGRVGGAGRVATHNGGNGWSYGELARFLDSGRFVFWISNTAVRAGRWNLERQSGRVTRGLYDAASPAP